MKLCIDTCTNVCTVALVENDKVLTERTYNDKLKHSEILMVEVDEMLKRLEKTSEDISEVFVTNGPGSFTGIRIGVTVANTISDTLKIKVNDYSALDVIAANHSFSNRIICSMLYARNERYYFAIYSSNNGELEVLHPYDVLTIDEIIDEVKSNYDDIIFTGDLNESHLEKLNANGTVSSNAYNIPKASVMPFMKVSGRENCDIDKINDMFVKPLYLEKSQAEKMSNN